MISGIAAVIERSDNENGLSPPPVEEHRQEALENVRDRQHADDDLSGAETERDSDDERNSVSREEVSTDNDDIDSLADPDEQVLQETADLLHRWASVHPRINAELNDENAEPVARPGYTLFCFDEYFPSNKLWPKAVPFERTVDWSVYTRDPQLIAQGQPKYIIDPPSYMAYVASNFFDVTPHPRADMYQPGLSRAMVAYFTDPYFYIDVGIPPHDMLSIPPLPIGFHDDHPGILSRFVYPGPEDPIIPIFYNRPENAPKMIEDVVDID